MKRFQRFFISLNITGIFFLITCVKTFVKLDQHVWSLSWSNTEVLNRFQQYCINCTDSQRKQLFTKLSLHFHFESVTTYLGYFVIIIISFPLVIPPPPISVFLLKLVFLIQKRRKSCQLKEPNILEYEKYSVGTISSIISYCVPNRCYTLTTHQLRQSSSNHLQTSLHQFTLKLRLP